MRVAWPQPAGYSALRNLVGMLLGPAPMSQLQAERLPPPSHLTRNGGPSSNSRHRWEMGLPLARCCQAVRRRYVCGIQLKRCGYQFSPMVVLAQMKQPAGWIANPGVKPSPLEKE